MILFEGVKLSFVPFCSAKENIQFTKCVLDNDFLHMDNEQAAIAFGKYVNGVKIMPKLPVHLGTH